MQARLEGLKTTVAPRAPSFRIGSVPYLNAVPLTHHLGPEVMYLPPSELARRLHAGDLDAALLSLTEALIHPEYDVLDGVAIASDGPVASVFLAHREPLESISEVAVDPASCTSVNLLRELLAERGLHPRFVPLRDYASAANHPNLLLIGNPALDFRRRNPYHPLWDLGAAWKERTGLPFVYAVWVLRRGTPAALWSALLDAGQAGIDGLPAIIAAQTEYDLAFRRAYLGGHIRYHLGAAEKSGIVRFADLIGTHTGQTVHPVNYVHPARPPSPITIGGNLTCG